MMNMEDELDQLISGCGGKTYCFPQLFKETGLRCGEAWDAKWTDIDTEKSTIVVRPEKNIRSRGLRISGRLIAMTNNLPRTSPYLFRTEEQDRIGSLSYAGRNFERQWKDCHKITKPSNTPNPLPHVPPLEGDSRIPENQGHTARHRFA